jgi:GTP-binding protein HflX
VLERRDDEQFAHLHIALDKADLARFERRYDYRPATS